MTSPTTYLWKGTDQDSAVRRVLKEWEGTPWRDAISVGVPGGQANCWTFVAGVLCALEGRDRIKLPALHAQALLHRTGEVEEAMRELFGHFQYEKHKVGSVLNAVNSADVLVTYDGHALLAGTRPNTVWHSDARRPVCMASVNDFAVSKIYKITNREDWC